MLYQLDCVQLVQDCDPVLKKINHGHTFITTVWYFLTQFFCFTIQWICRTINLSITSKLFDSYRCWTRWFVFNFRCWLRTHWPIWCSSFFAVDIMINVSNKSPHTKTCRSWSYFNSIIINIVLSFLIHKLSYILLQAFWMEKKFTII